MIEIQTNIDYLIPDLRLHLGDVVPTQYRYLDSWLRTALVLAIKILARRWDTKYLVDESIYTMAASGTVIASGVYRNVESVSYLNFEVVEPPVVQFKDEWPIILMASIIIKSGQLENLSWDIGSWRDSELAMSNIESGKEKADSLRRDISELENILKPPLKRLVKTSANRFAETS